jgi:hypothetical protein
VSIPHTPTRACNGIHCHSHGVDEAAVDGAYVGCMECGHLYLTRNALRNEYRMMLVDLNRLSAKLGIAALPDDIPVPPPELINFCPLCGADL